MLSLLQIFEPEETPQDYSMAQNLPDIPEHKEILPAPSPPSFIPPPTRSGRVRKFPALFKDFLPTSTSRIPVPHMPPMPSSAAAVPVWSELPNVVSVIAEEPATVDSSFTTEPDEFGLYRVYPRKPYHEPDEDITLTTSSESPDSDRWWKGFNPRMDQDEALNSKSPFSPLSNPTSFHILNWFYGGSRQKSQAELTSLIGNVFRAKTFDQEDAANFSFSREMALLDSINDPSAPFSNDNIWKTSTIKIPLPCERQKFSSENHAHKLRIRNVRHRSLLEVMRTAAKDESSKSWHNTPFKMFWKPTPESPPQRVVSELYNADAFLEEHKKIEREPLHLPDDPPGPKPVENAVFGIMVWSDSTHLTNFGDASMWPIYLYSGSQSKYSRGKPSQHSAHHVAHIPSVSFSLSLNMSAHQKINLGAG